MARTVKRAASPGKKSAAGKAAPREVVPGSDSGGSGSDRLERAGVQDSVSGAPAKTSAAKRSAPPVQVPERVSRTPGSPSRSVRELQVALTDLGLYAGRINGYYDGDTRNAVSDLQVRLRTDGYLQAAPNGIYNDATRDAVRAHPGLTQSD